MALGISWRDRGGLAIGPVDEDRNGLPAGARPGAPALNNRAIDATEVSQKMHAVANTVRLGLHDVLGAHHRARILISIGT